MIPPLSGFLIHYLFEVQETPCVSSLVYYLLVYCRAA